MKKIIVATDYSAAANNALQYAANLANVVDADLVLFNVFHMSVHARNAIVGPDTLDHIIKNNDNRLQLLADETADKYHVNVSWVSKTADTVEELAQYVADHPADLVVMGMESNIAEYKLLGNTTTAVVRSLKFPVLVVPNDVPYNGIERILYACEYTYLTEDNHLSLLKEITKKFAANLQVLHVNTKAKDHVLVAADDEMVSAIDNLMHDVDHSYSVVENPKIGDGIAQGVEAFQADLLVMVPHRKGFLESILKGSATREMTLKTRVPLLVLPNLL